MPVIRTKRGWTVSLSFVTVDAFRPGAEPGSGRPNCLRKPGEQQLSPSTCRPTPRRPAPSSPTCLRVRFSPRAPWDYGTETSVAVINRDLGHPDTRVVERHSELIVDTSAMHRGRSPALWFACLQGPQLICADQPGRNLVYRSGEHGVANIKRMPENAVYCGFGEKARRATAEERQQHDQLQFPIISAMPGADPGRHEGGPLNPMEPLYASIPLLIEINRAPTGDYAGPPYCYGLFFDNVSQSFFNIGDDTYADMRGRYAFGALFGELDYYLFLGDGVPDILNQFTSLTGRSSMPPKYAFDSTRAATATTIAPALSVSPAPIARPAYLSMVCTSTSTFRTTIASSPTAR